MKFIDSRFTLIWSIVRRTYCSKVSSDWCVSLKFNATSSNTTQTNGKGYSGAILFSTLNTYIPSETFTENLGIFKANSNTIFFGGVSNGWNLKRIFKELLLFLNMNANTRVFNINSKLFTAFKIVDVHPNFTIFAVKLHGVLYYIK